MTTPVTFTFNGEKFTGEQGQSIAAILVAANHKVLRKTRFNSKPRSVFCGIGICFDCVVTIDGIANQRSCLVEALNGMNVESGS